MNYFLIYPSPLGDLLLESDGEFLTGLRFSDGFSDARENCENRENRDPSVLPVFRETVDWLDLYFDRKIPDFTPQFKLNVSPFVQAVCAILMKIPFGQTTTYGGIAEQIAKTRGVKRFSAQAVGQAVGRNPVAIIVPCHRVIGKDKTLTGYAPGLSRKQALLAFETNGAAFRISRRLEGLRLKDLQPSQFYVSAKKLSRVEPWLIKDPSAVLPIPVKILCGVPVMTDGHTRAAAALRAGIERLPLTEEQDELDWRMYERCVKACRERGIFSPRDLLTRIVDEKEYAEKWDRWCDEMQKDVIGSSVVIKEAETDEELLGKAYVHYKAWQEAYKGLIDQSYLDSMTLEKCKQIALTWRDNVLIAEDERRVVGFAVYGLCRDEDRRGAGEVYAIYVLSDFYGTGVGRKLMQASLDRIALPQTVVWTLKDNARAIRFYEKCGFKADGKEKEIVLGSPAAVVRMVRE